MVEIQMFFYITHSSISYIIIANRHCILNQQNKSNFGTIIYWGKSISVTYKEIQLFFCKIL